MAPERNSGRARNLSDSRGFAQGDRLSPRWASDTVARGTCLFGCRKKLGSGLITLDRRRTHPRHRASASAVARCWRKAFTLGPTRRREVCSAQTSVCGPSSTPQRTRRPAATSGPTRERGSRPAPAPAMGRIAQGGDRRQLQHGPGRRSGRCAARRGPARSFRAPASCGPRREARVRGLWLVSAGRAKDGAATSQRSSRITQRPMSRSSGDGLIRITTS